MRLGVDSHEHGPQQSGNDPRGVQRFGQAVHEIRRGLTGRGGTGLGRAEQRHWCVSLLADHVLKCRVQHWKNTDRLQASISIDQWINCDPQCCFTTSGPQLLVVWSLTRRVGRLQPQGRRPSGQSRSYDSWDQLGELTLTIRKHPRLQRKSKSTNSNSQLLHKPNLHPSPKTC